MYGRSRTAAAIATAGCLCVVPAIGSPIANITSPPAARLPSAVPVAPSATDAVSASPPDSEKTEDRHMSEPSPRDDDAARAQRTERLAELETIIKRGLANF